MKKAGWAKRIKAACISAGTYQPFFDDVIDSLAKIMEKRDAIDEEYKRLGEKPIYIHTNKSGEKNPAKNPLLAQWSDCNKDALQYWRDLGLTPAGYKRINEKAATSKTASFEELLVNIGA